MLKVKFEGVEVDNCTGCHGIFFDAFEKEQLLKMKGAEAIDFGDLRVGRQFNKVHRINCPRCGSRMIRMVDLDQPHIGFEHCTVCGGSFFDAGEFRDLMHHSIVDFFRDLVVQERTQRHPSDTRSPSGKARQETKQ